MIMGEFLQSDHSPITDESKISWLSRRELVLIVIGGIVSAVLGLLLVVPADSIYDFAPLLLSANAVSMNFAIGLFFFLTAGLLFSSRASHLYIMSRINEVGAKKAFLTRILHVLIITSVFSVLMVVAVFLYPVVLLLLVYRPPTFGHFAFFPAVLGAALIGSVLLTLIASSLAIFMDDSRLCVALGCVSTLLLAFLGGWNAAPSPFDYSLTRNLAFLSPHNIVRALAITLSGYQFESANRMVEYVGFAFSAENLVVPLLLCGSISIVLLIVAQRVLVKNSGRWALLGMMPPRHEIWPSTPSPEKSQETARTGRSLRIQRGLTVLMIAVLLVSTSAGLSLYTTNVSNNTTFIHYVSPGDNEEISVGVWNVYEVDVQPPFPGLFNSLFMFIDVNSWGNASDSLSFYCGIVNMSSTEFNSLDEASRLAHCPHPYLNRTSSGHTGFGAGHNLEEYYGPCVCVLLIIADANPLENSYIEASLLIVQEGI
jgi:hypothetical protein